MQKTWLPYAILAVLLLAVMMFSARQGSRDTTPELPYSVFKEQIAGGGVQSVTIRGD